MSEIADAGFMDHVRSKMAHALMRGVLEAGAISFKDGPPSRWEMTTPILATVGVVSPRIVGAMQQRIRERQTEIARRAADIAIAGIQGWGSYYGGETVTKAIAAAEVRRATQAAIDDFTKRDA